MLRQVLKSSLKNNETSTVQRTELLNGQREVARPLDLSVVKHQYEPIFRDNFRCNRTSYPTHAFYHSTQSFFFQIHGLNVL